MKKQTYIYIGLVTIIGWYLYQKFMKKSKSSTTVTTVIPEITSDTGVLDVVGRQKAIDAGLLKPSDITDTSNMPVLSNYPY